MCGATWPGIDTSGTVVGMGPEWIVVLVVFVLLFGSSQLPKLARSVGQAQKEFKKGIDQGEAEDEHENKNTNTNTNTDVS